MRESYRLIKEMVSQKAFDPYRGEPLEPNSLPCSAEEIDGLIRERTNAGFHLCGTCKMGSAKDPTAVVDPETRVRDLRGLRVVDGSIMPSIVSSNPNAVIMMLGERASDMILGKPLLAPDYQDFHRPERLGAAGGVDPP